MHEKETVIFMLKSWYEAILLPFLCKHDTCIIYISKECFLTMHGVSYCIVVGKNLTKKITAAKSIHLLHMHDV